MDYDLACAHTDNSTIHPEPVPDRRRVFNRMVQLFQLNCKQIFLIFLLILVSKSHLTAQTNTETEGEAEKHSPHRASIYSAILPGLGQAYNRKYWKIPVIYAGFGIMFYTTAENTREYRKFREAFSYVINKDTFPINNPYIGRYNEQQLRSGMNFYRRNVELGYIVAGVWYVLNIIDASVDAHFFDFEVSENLAMKVEPAIICDPRAGRIRQAVALTFRF